MRLALPSFALPSFALPSFALPSFVLGLLCGEMLRRSGGRLLQTRRALLAFLLPHRPPPRALLSSLRCIIFDCDGVLYRGKSAIPGAPQALAALRAAGIRLLFVTNAATASRTALASKLTQMGYSGISPTDCVTSASATASYLARTHTNVKKAYVVGGGGGLSEELAAVGVEALGADDVGKGLQAMIDEGWSSAVDGAGIGAVVVGMQAEGLGYACLAKAAGYARDPARAFVATNEDASFPASSNFDVDLPAGGSLVAMVAYGADRRPDVYVGKPSKDLACLVMQSFGLQPKSTLMVGDRCNTDIAFGLSVGMHTCLVLSGVHTRAHAYTADARPEFVAESVLDLAAALS